MIEALEKQYADVLAPLKDSMTPKKFGLKYVQKLAKRNSVYPYTVPDDVSSLITLSCVKDLIILWAEYLCISFSARDSFEHHEKVARCLTTQDRNAV